MADHNSANSIEQQLRHYIAEQILFSSHFPYPDDTSFLESGIVDSMNVMEIVLHTETAYKIKVSDHEIVPDNFDSVSKIAAYIRRKTGQPAAVQA